MHKECGYHQDAIKYLEEQCIQGNITNNDMILLVYYPYKSKFIASITIKDTLPDNITKDLDHIYNHTDIDYKDKGYALLHEMGFDISDKTAEECRDIKKHGTLEVNTIDVRDSIIHNLLYTGDLDDLVQDIDDNIAEFNDTISKLKILQ